MDNLTTAFEYKQILKIGRGNNNFNGLNNLFYHIRVDLMVSKLEVQVKKDIEVRLRHERTVGRITLSIARAIRHHYNDGVERAVILFVA